MPNRDGRQQGSAPSVPRLLADNDSPDGDQSPAVTRITLRPHDPGTGEEIEKREVVKGYEYSRGQFLSFAAEELKALEEKTPAQAAPAADVDEAPVAEAAPAAEDVADAAPAEEATDTPAEPAE